MPNVPALRRGGFALRPHESRSFVYYGDDIAFDRILVQSSSGSHYTRVISRPRGRGDVFEIGLLSELPESDAPIVEAAVRFRYAPKRVLILWLPWLGPVLLAWGFAATLLRIIREVRHEPR